MMMSKYLPWHLANFNAQWLSLHQRQQMQQDQPGQAKTTESQTQNQAITHAHEQQSQNLSGKPFPTFCYTQTPDTFSQPLAQSSELPLSDSSSVTPSFTTGVNTIIPSASHPKLKRERVKLKSHDSLKPKVKSFYPKPTRPVSARQQFIKERRPEFRKKHQGRSSEEISKLLAEEWEKLSQEEKNKREEECQLTI